MTALLEQALARLRQFPEDEQDRIASSLLEELESEADWNRQFGASQDLLASMGAEALTNLRAGRTTPLDPETM